MKLPVPIVAVASPDYSISSTIVALIKFCWHRMKYALPELNNEFGKLFWENRVDSGRKRRRKPQPKRPLQKHNLHVHPEMNLNDLKVAKKFQVQFFPCILCSTFKCAPSKFV